MITKNKILTLLAATFLSCSLSLVQAQGDPGEDPDPTNVPIDGGLSLLIAAGVGYAAKKGYDKRKKDNAADNTTDSEE